MLESIVDKIKQKEEEANKKIINAKIKADYILKMAEKKRNVLIRKYESIEKELKEDLPKRAMNGAKKEIERIKNTEERKLDLELKNSEKKKKKAIQFVKDYLCD